MAEAFLVRAALAPDMIAAGRRLLGHLDSAGTLFPSAFWLLDEEVREWRLILASAAVRTGGPRVLYRKISQALSDLGLEDSISILMVSVASDGLAMVEGLVEAFGGLKTVDGMRLENSTIGGVQLAGCLLYRVTAAQAVSRDGSPV